MPKFDYRTMRGFGYQPSYSPAMAYNWTHFDAAVWRREVPYATRFGSNTLRIWLDWGAWLILGDDLLKRFDRALDIIHRNGMRTIPVLFNRWVDPRYPVGGISDNDLRASDWSLAKFDPYVDALATHFRCDERILLWDVCNEPLWGTRWNAEDILFREHVWLANVADRLRRGSGLPITIGAMVDHFVHQTAALCDVISFHPYPNEPGEMDKMCRDHVAIAKRFGKPLICTESCCGSFDDQERGRLARECIETLERHGIGWVVWSLCAGKFVTLSRKRVDSNAVRPNEGYMPFVLENGRTRPGHEWLEQRAKQAKRRT